MSQSLTQAVHKQVADAIVEAFKQMQVFAWVRSQEIVNPRAHYVQFR